MNKVWLLLIGLTLHQSSAAQPLSDSSHSTTIKILSWNIYMLPHLVAGHSGKKLRAEAIGKELTDSDYDVIVFQEAFHATARKKILHELKNRFPFCAGPANRKLISPLTNSGILILSRYPIKMYQSIQYKTRGGSDALARKGALLIELNVDGQCIQIAGTHLQNAGGLSMKHAQCDEFFDRLLKPFAKPGVPQIICGDFNIDRKKYKTSYQFMLRSLDAIDNMDSTLNAVSYDRDNNDLYRGTEKGNELIDYILVRNNGGQIKNTGFNVRRIKRKWNQQHADLSDHFSLEASFVLTRTPLPIIAHAD